MAQIARNFHVKLRKKTFTSTNSPAKRGSEVDQSHNTTGRIQMCVVEMNTLDVLKKILVLKWH